MRKLFFLIFFLSFFALTSCQKEEAANVIKVGTIAGPETELMEVAKDIAKKQHDIDIKIIQFTDYTMPNAALAEGSIDANMFQSIPYFEADTKARRLPLTIIGKTFVYPMALYSLRVKSVQDVPERGVIAIPNDASNEARALFLLEKAGLIKLKPNASATASLLDIASNPKRLEIKPLDAAQLPRVLPDVSLAAINTNFAIPAGLSPKKNGLFMEDKNSPYANVIAVRTDRKDDPRFKVLVEALQSPEVEKRAEKLFHGLAIPAWK